MLRYDRQTKPGLVALYDIRPGNGASQFLQPRSPHAAFYCYIQKETASGRGIKTTTSPQICCCTTLWKVNV